jgi:SAM-dependent methyltransferase
MRTLKRVPLLVDAVRAVRRLPGVATLRRAYAELFPHRVFTNIYRENMWSDSDSRSGSGSNLAATEPIRRALPGLLRDLQGKTLLDIPCGDFHWMNTVDLDGTSYTGADIVPDLIAHNRAHFGRAGRTFIVLNASGDTLPRVDVILCRDLLIHLSLASIDRVLANVRRSGSSWLAVSTYPHCTVNADIRTGGYRDLNLQAAPFHFPAPSRLICEELEPHTRSDAKYLGVWRVADLPQ